ncbi:hypothetical protein BTA35_0203545 [Oceanospirillum linum]|uniref:Uncharacterized protein n=1 Tax=Oceanospirillum linum TaxID=966 RepID=A0A1T1HFE2_OCELI|nr:hypothetical protein BTA35_0203545 [Oceanospirillum linum]
MLFKYISPYRLDLYLKFGLVGQEGFCYVPSGGRGKILGYGEPVDVTGCYICFYKSQQEKKKIFF